MRKFRVIKYLLLSHYLRLLLISIILPALFVGSCLYYLIFKILAEDLGIPEVISAHLLPVVHKIDGILLLGLPLIIIFLVAWGLVLSTRMTGPITRMERAMDRIAKGDYSVRIKLRKRDDLKSIADGINSLLDAIERLQKEKGR